MDDILKAVASLRLNGTDREEAGFKVFQSSVLRDLRREEIAVLRELKGHHVNTLRHSMMVARDVYYIGKRMGIKAGKLQDLMIAAILHDVGKLDVHEVILDLSDEDEIAIWRSLNPGQEPPNNIGLVIKGITLGDVIVYKSRKSKNPRGYRSDFLVWVRDKGLSRFLKRSILEYLQHHQAATGRILEEIGVRKEVVDLAVSHHPSYFSKEKREKLPKECTIMEVADKFNAIIQSGGVRRYFAGKTRTEALDIIAFELRKEFGALRRFSGFGRRALGILIKRELPPAVEIDIIPRARGLIRQLEGGAKRRVEESEGMVALITMTLGLCKKFKSILDNKTTNILLGIQGRIKVLLHAR
tara:strand:- start:156 stop:1223 length:1068 start_codon:yes stop_codon:yes gene_type:complete